MQPLTQDEQIEELQKAIEDSKYFLTKYQNQFINNLRKKFQEVSQREANKLVQEYRGRNVNMQEKITPKLKAIQITFMEEELKALKEMEEDPNKFGEEEAGELLKAETLFDREKFLKQ